MNNKVIIGVSIIIALSLFSIIAWFVFEPADLIIQGEVEATEVKVASKLVGRIANMHVKEGEQVKKGQLLIELDSPEIHAKMEQVTALQKAAKAQSLKANNGARGEQVDGAFNVWQKAKAASDLMEKTYARVLNLYNEGVLPEQKKDETETKMKAAKLTENAAKSQYDMAKKGARYEDKSAALALVEQADGAVNEVNSYLSETNLKATISGEISSIIAEEGELIGSGVPVISIINLDDSWVTFNVREDLLSKIKKGMEFTAMFPALGEQNVKLKVTYIKALGNFASWRATKASGSFDMKTFEVRAVPVDKQIELRPGMTAVVNWDNI